MTVTAIELIDLLLEGHQWYFRFGCPVCKKSNYQKAVFEAGQIVCTECGALLDASRATTAYHSRQSSSPTVRGTK